ncbi:MAG: hypothetical protein ACE5KD_00905 [Candidatus Bathyarchaeia archaeon]
MTRNPIYYCPLHDEILKEEDTIHCITKECRYLLLLKPEELEYLREVYKK